uniref:RNA-directed DNA polymerase, eukaryota n=1 Tax=Tanacetum cinerariifolium TaxID=118510 RepID=A0A699KYW4_TANCI|nr:RNA-directed DNA polymerase, eukaryota [Tanacetum cinerariifolium]
MEGDNKVQYAGSSGDNSEVSEVPKTNFDESIGPKVDLSDDPFGIYPLLNKNSNENKDNVNEKDQSLKYPPGFTPNAEENDRNVNGDKSQKCNTKEVFAGRDGDSTNKGSKGDALESTPYTKENDRNVNGNKSQKCNTKEDVKSEVSRTRGSFLCLMEEVMKVGSVDGSSMNFLSLNIQGLFQKAKKDWVKELSVNNKVNFLAIQETKTENMELRCVRSCWGNYAFDYIHSNSVGNSGGIMCAWDPNSFRKTVYAPHDPRDKRMLWDYLVYTINQWDGEVVIMDDFNEVRHKSDRFGSIFNGQGADEFNSFIANAGLEEVPLGGSAFTWGHKSATKMRKLDRFLISKNLLLLALALPLLLWRAPGDASNGMRNMMCKLKFIKLKTREWIKSNRHSRTGMKEKYKEEL